jgi:hypothetical protein
MQKVKAAAMYTKFRETGACDGEDEIDFAPRCIGELDWDATTFKAAGDFASVAADATRCCILSAS